MEKIITWPGWESVRRIGAGSFGTVYEIQRNTDGSLQKAALKVLTVPESPEDIQDIYDAGIADTEDEIATYLDSQIKNISKEFEVMERLQGCRSIVQMQEFMIIPHKGWAGADILIRMELLTPLTKHMRTHSLDENEVIRLGMDICSALEACQHHNPPILHRDIKIANILMDEEGNYKLGDFGVARAMEGTRSAHTRVGTEAYMAPEVVRGSGYHATADIYSLGIVLYRFLNNNRSPFLPTEGPLTEELILDAKEKVLSGTPIPAPLHGTGALKNTILKAVSFEPLNRYRTATDFRAALEACCEEIIEDEKTAFLDESTVRLLTEDKDKVRKAKEEKANHEMNGENETTINERHEKLIEILDENPDRHKRWIPLVIGGLAALMVMTVFIGTTLSRKQSGAEVASLDANTDIVEESQENEEENLSETEPEEAELTEDLEEDERDAIENVTSVEERDADEMESIQESQPDAELDERYTYVDILKYSTSRNQELTSIEIDIDTPILLAGDAVLCKVSGGGWVFYGGAGEIKWSIVEGQEYADISEYGVLIGKSAGKATVKAEYKGVATEKEIDIVEVDKNSNATITTKIGMVPDVEWGEKYSTKQVIVHAPFSFYDCAIYAYQPYDSEYVCLFSSDPNINESEKKRRKLSKDETYVEVSSRKGQGGYIFSGDITILLYDKNDMTHVMDAKKIYIDQWRYYRS